MIQSFIDKFEQNKSKLREQFEKSHPENYQDVVKGVIKTLSSEDDYRMPDSDNIHEIDDGHCQGTLLYVIPESCYQPDTYWVVKVDYGSCSGCDTLQSINGYSDESPTKQQVDDYMTLALHIVQGLKEI